MLEIDEIRKLTEESKKNNVKQKIQKITSDDKIELTDKEKIRVLEYVADIEQHIPKFAKQASDKFRYDCSELERHIFFEIAKKFKEHNPRFYVQTHGGNQLIMIDWTGKNEV